MDILAPTSHPSQRREWITENQKTTQALFQCIAQGNCAQNQTKVVIIECHHFVMVKQGGWAGGEGIWASSTLRALNNMGYSVVISPTSRERTVQLYHIFGSLVKMIILDPEHNVKWDTDIVRTIDNPSGIPVWLLFSFSFWPSQSHLLTPKWSLTPENYFFMNPSNTYLGYSIEEQCSRFRFIPHSEREMDIWVLGKSISYFQPEYRAWDPDFFDLAANSTGVSFIAGVGGPNQHYRAGNSASEVKMAASITNFGPLSQDEFYSVLSRSRAIVGMSAPVLSPTPYDALCFGVPFINPITQWDRQNPNDRNRWQTQHDGLRHLSPPYVYHVHKGDRDGFVQAIKDAIDNPIQSYVLDRMRISAVEYRLGQILEHDWRAEAEEVLEERKVSGEGEVSCFLPHSILRG
ncbi:hypothetical protein B0H11DRAFT_1760765 [Mycena galericulata]|nr:hypothetical protein B0H11DRAFT_1760765 [Mycena galericulata]